MSFEQEHVSPEATGEQTDRFNEILDKRKEVRERLMDAYGKVSFTDFMRMVEREFTPLGKDLDEVIEKERQSRSPQGRKPVNSQ